MQIAIKHSNMLPGILTNEVEFFALDSNTVKGISGGLLMDYHSFPERILNMVRKDMAENPDCVAALPSSSDPVFQYIRLCFGGLDTVPDFDCQGRANRMEYVNDGLRKTAPIGNGQHLTYSELRVLKLVDLPDKIIASDLNISEYTVLTHWQHMRAKTGLTGKVELALWASKKGII